MQAQNSPSMDISFDITEYLGEEIISASKGITEPALSASTKDQLQELATYLNADIADLVCDAGPIRDIFNSIKQGLPSSARDALLPAAYIESHGKKLLEAVERLTTHESLKDLPARELQRKQ